MITADGFSGVVSNRMAAEAVQLSAAWLEQLRELLLVGSNEVFPSDQILDHIPVLIEDIARYLQAPSDEEIAANAQVIDKARELGLLRHSQQASVHQLLREFEILGEILEAFVVDEVSRIGLTLAPVECFEVLRRVTRATRAIMRTAIDTFVAEYTATIQERNDRLATFNRMASHELRTPLGTLMFAAAAMEQPAVAGDPARMAKVSHAVRTSTERLARLVENLQRIARLAESSDAPNTQQVDLSIVATEAGRQLDEMAAARGVSIVIAPELPHLIIDPARVELVLMNLVSNAIKYSDGAKPNPVVEIAVEDVGVNPGVLTLIVRDNGIGVPDELQPDMFERFTRAHAHMDEVLGVSGSGLGLSIVAECVQAMGGQIRCVSEVGVGTSFYVTLPTEPARSPAP
ncbi:MAG: HAMP domain-containing histidine kinase [Acidobacteriota bacterium]|nr:HAMP domain-containing histidine kinase [Acidobacteriota bacterium]